MAFKLTEDDQQQFHAAAGTPVVIGIQPPTTLLGAGYYNGASLTPDASGNITFAPVVGHHLLTITATPPYPPEIWKVVEVDGGNTQVLEVESASWQVINLIIIGQ